MGSVETLVAYVRQSRGGRFPQQNWAKAVTNGGRIRMWYLHREMNDGEGMGSGGYRSTNRSIRAGGAYGAGVGTESGADPGTIGTMDDNR